MAFVVRRVVKLAAGGIGLGREAYLHHKDKKEAASQGPLTNPPAEGSRSPSGNPSLDDDIYVQLPEDHAEELIAKGHAYPVSEETKGRLRPADDDSDSDDSVDVKDDWEADEEADLPPPPSYESVVEGQEYERYDDKGKRSPSSNDAPQSSREASQPREQAAKQTSTLVQQVVASAGPVPTQRTPLYYPVVIPQRRPGAKTRGFVRGYAPDLAASGIGQDTFMRFLHNFDEASKASPYLQALFISAGVVGFVPGVIPMAVSIAVQVASGTAIELQSRYRANAFLDQINRDLFMPRGLYAMVMRYKPQSKVPDSQMEFGYGEVNLETAKSIARWAPGLEPTTSGPPGSGMKIMKQIRLSSGVRREIDMPILCAPLIFPTGDGGAMLEKSVATEGPQKERTFKEKIKAASDFINDYYDRRGQAEYLKANPNSTLGNQTAAPQFRSRYADPTNSTNQRPFNLLTGGVINMPPRADRRAVRRELKNERRIGRGREPRLPRGERKPRGPVGYLMKGVKKALHEDVLYLTIVELPSQQELDEARQVLLANGWMK